MLATKSEARIHAAREIALTAEAVLQARQEDARDLRKSHEKAVAELSAEMAEKRRRGKEGVAARLEVIKFWVLGFRLRLLHRHSLWFRRPIKENHGWFESQTHEESDLGDTRTLISCIVLRMESTFALSVQLDSLMIAEYGAFGVVPGF